MKTNLLTLLLAICLVLSIGYHLNFRLNVLKEYKKELKYEPKTYSDVAYHYAKLRIYREVVLPELHIDTDSLEKEEIK